VTRECLKPNLARGAHAAACLPARPAGGPARPAGGPARPAGGPARPAGGPARPAGIRRLVTYPILFQKY